MTDIASKRGLLIVTLIFSFLMFSIPLAFADNEDAYVSRVTNYGQFGLVISPLAITLDNSVVQPNSMISGNLVTPIDYKTKCLSGETVKSIKFTIKDLSGNVKQISTVSGFTPVPCSASIGFRFSVKVGDLANGNYRLSARVFDNTGQDVTLLESNGEETNYIGFTVSASGGSLNCPAECGAWSECQEQYDGRLQQQRTCSKLSGDGRNCFMNQEFRYCATDDTGGDSSDGAIGGFDVGKFTATTWILIIAFIGIVVMLLRRFLR